MEKIICIIDDDLIYRLIVQKMIKRNFPSQVCHECENGEEGLKLLSSFQKSPLKIIVLLDINMPVLDGWGFLNKLEENNLYNIQDLSIYLVSSSTDHNDISRANQYGFIKKFIHKPLSSEDLKIILG
ncbi:response regulator [Aquiflexum lacus]|uniref:response regulator n=1 Tax=Aquiflexum lacus TaxID=2483805 RepID=UPI001895A628|nr:response regulator [Aquiflexum lacus]